MGNQLEKQKENIFVLIQRYKEEFGNDISPLVVASEKGRLNHVKRFITVEGVNSFGKNTWGRFTPLLAATYAEHFDVVQYLLEQGADPSIFNGAIDAIYVAVMLNKKSGNIAELLIKHMDVANINKIYIGDKTLLDGADANFRKEILGQKVADLIRSKGGKKYRELDTSVNFNPQSTNFKY